MTSPNPDLSSEDISTVVRGFYASVRNDAVLGPVFAVHVEDWPAHEDKIIAFWQRVIRNQAGYQGNPMAAHQQAGNVQPGMFERWLALFDATLEQHLPAQQAEGWSQLAHRLGRKLRAGISNPLRPGEVPNLRQSVLRKVPPGHD